ncbi:MAG: hypothetical protein II957_04905, partial [Treponema sp.]|nr:hypothetical protein [Treponema sp.]
GLASVNVYYCTDAAVVMLETWFIKCFHLSSLQTTKGRTHSSSTVHAAPLPTLRFKKEKAVDRIFAWKFHTKKIPTTSLPFM